MTIFRSMLSVAGPRRRLQLAVTLVLALVGALAELVTIGAVLPLLAIASAPQAALPVPIIGPLVAVTGIAPGTHGLVLAAAFLVGATVASGVLRLILTWVSQKFVFGLHYDLVMRIYGRAVRQDYDVYLRQNSSVLLSGLEKTYIIIAGVLAPALLAVTSAIIAIFIILFLLFLDPLTALAAAALIGLLYVAMSVLAQRTMKVVSTGLSDLRTERIKTVQESLGGIRDILVDHSQSVFERKFERQEAAISQFLAKMVFMQQAPRLVVESAIIILVAVLAAWFGLHSGGIISAIPVLGALAVGAQRLLPLIQSIYLGWSSYAVNADSAFDVIRLINAPVSNTVPLERGQIVRPLTREIVLVGIDYRYTADGPPALRNINLNIAKGERVGLIGKTGSGKSTLVDILMGLLRPSSGEMRVDGEGISENNIANWQAQIAHVPQVIFLSDDTLTANIAFGYEPDDVDLERIADAAAKAGISEFVDQLPHGFKTAVGERGVRLSGGQRQRIGIARALYKKATVLILDEATSALDSETEAAVMDSVGQLDRSLTLVMIAHRLTSLSGCDRILRLERGQIVASSSFNELAKSSLRRAGS